MFVGIDANILSYQPEKEQERNLWQSQSFVWKLVLLLFVYLGSLILGVWRGYNFSWAFCTVQSWFPVVLIQPWMNIFVPTKGQI